MSDKMEIPDLSRWATKTGITVEKIILKKQLPCMGFCLMFPALNEEGQSVIDYHISLAEDKNNPISKEDRERFTRGLEMVVEQVVCLFEGYDPDKKEELH